LAFPAGFVDLQGKSGNLLGKSGFKIKEHFFHHVKWKKIGATTLSIMALSITIFSVTVNEM
jgi:hypothetical protein